MTWPLRQTCITSCNRLSMRSVMAVLPPKSNSLTGYYTWERFSKRHLKEPHIVNEPRTSRKRLAAAYSVRGSFHVGGSFLRSCRRSRAKSSGQGEVQTIRRPVVG